MQVLTPINSGIFRDSAPIEFGMDALDPEDVQLAWSRLSKRDSSLAWAKSDVPGFLSHFGLALPGSPGEPCKLTWAGLLMFGKQAVLRDLLPGRRILLEAQFLDPEGYDYHAELDGNLFEVFHALMRFVRTHYPEGAGFANAAFPCLRDAVFGEMITNLLVHRDYGVQAPARLLFRKDRVTFENPGRPRQRGLLDLAAVDSYPMNPVLYAFFREAGWIPKPGRGLALFAERGEEYFGIPMLAFDRENFKVIAPVTLDFPVSRASAEATMQASKVQNHEATKGPFKLVDRQPFETIPAPSGYVQPEGFSSKKPEKISEIDKSSHSMQVDGSSMQVSGRETPVEELASGAEDRIRKILEFCESPRNREEIQKHVGLNNRDHFRKHVLLPLLREGRLLATFPDKPNSPKQQYRTARDSLAESGARN